MRLSDIQPHYFPRLHYFARMLSSDVFVLRDDVQFVKNHKFPDGTRGVSHQAHTPIKSASGAVLLNISVKKGGLPPISQAMISYEQDWTRKHLNLLRNHYAKAPRFAAIFPDIELLLAKRFPTVGELNTATLCWASALVLGVDTPTDEYFSLPRVNKLVSERSSLPLRQIVAGSEVIPRLEVDEPVTATEKIATLCRYYDAEEYIAGGTAFDSYMDADVFRRNDIAIVVQDWVCERYRQRYDEAGFLPNLSIIDLLMNVSGEDALGLLLEKRLV
ncbi:MAG: WbqC family protein [Gammaproteobacteria bacterium]